MATVANANTAGGATMKDGSQMLEEKPLNRKTFVYKRTLQHYITNNNKSSTPSVSYDTDDAVTVYQQGWAHIPFTKINAAMTGQDRDTITAQARKYRIVSQGFRIVKFNAMQQSASFSTSTTQTNNSFVQAPAALIYIDDGHELYELTYGEAPTGVARQIPIWGNSGEDGNPIVPNSSTAGVGLGDMAKIYAGFSNPTDGTSGLLIPVQHQLYSSSQMNINNFDVQNGGKVHLLQSGQEFEYTWHNPVTQWISPNYGVTLSQPSVTINLIKDTTTLNANYGTGVIENVWKPPVMHLIRMPPLQDALGNITLSAEIWIEYTCVVEIETGRFLFSRNIALNSLGQSLTQALPYPVSEREIFSQTNDPSVEEDIKRNTNRFKKPKLM